MCGHIGCCRRGTPATALPLPLLASPCWGTQKMFRTTAAIDCYCHYPPPFCQGCHPPPSPLTPPYPPPPPHRSPLFLHCDCSNNCGTASGAATTAAAATASTSSVVIFIASMAQRQWRRRKRRKRRRKRMRRAILLPQSG
jgi:hypothetical protein